MTDDRLGDMLELQNDLQTKAYGMEPLQLEGEERIQFFKDMKLALEAELQEAMDEMGWKPWATSKHWNEEAVKGELIDAWHFFMNLLLVAGMTPDELYSRYVAKRTKNIKRQEHGYDGVSGKCPICKRALDDTAVTCIVRDDGVNGWCMDGGFWASDKTVTQLPIRPLDYSGLEGKP